MLGTQPRCPQFHQSPLFQHSCAQVAPPHPPPTEPCNLQIPLHTHKFFKSIILLPLPTVHHGISSPGKRRHCLHPLEEKMGRCQCKKTRNNMKSLWHHQALVALQQQDLNITTDLKNNFMKILEALKEKMKNSLKEIEEVGQW